MRVYILRYDKYGHIWICVFLYTSAYGQKFTKCMKVSWKVWGGNSWVSFPRNYHRGTIVILARNQFYIYSRHYSSKFMQNHDNRLARFQEWLLYLTLIDTIASLNQSLTHSSEYTKSLQRKSCAHINWRIYIIISHTDKFLSRKFFLFISLTFIFTLLF